MQLNQGGSLGDLLASSLSIETYLAEGLKEHPNDEDDKGLTDD